MWRSEFLSFVRALRRNLNQGGRGALLLRPHPLAYAVTLPQLIALVVLGLVIGLAAQISLHGVHGTINPWAVRGALFDLPFVLLAGWWASRVSLRGLHPLSLPVARLSLGVALDVCVLLAILGLRPAPNLIGVAYWASVVWWWLCACVLLARLTGRGIRMNWPAWSLITLISLASLLPAAPLWQTAGSESAGPPHRPSIEREAAFHAQAHLLDEALQKLRPQRPGIEDLYFAGFASYAAEDVFRKEIDVIGPLMRQRFDAEGRSLLLVNHASTVLQLPLATQTNLRRALRGIGQRIDREEDVLVLYLTSHGSRAHELAVNFWPLELDAVTPASLKAMLDDAGIKWRVVIVSACYSGGYIEPLKGDTTLVMTASDATHTSFGCGSDSAFTYFGRALFDEELRRTYSFSQAFERARVSIRAREKKLQEDYSNPQMAMGAAIAEKLKRIEARLAGAERK